MDGSVITYVDISEQTALARQLAESLADIETIYRIAPIGLAQIDAYIREDQRHDGGDQRRPRR